MVQLDMFQFTHPVWGATSSSVAVNQWLSFQFTHPVWGATVSFQAGSKEYFLFQFTHPVWGATITQRKLRR